MMNSVINPAISLTITNNDPRKAISDGKEDVKSCCWLTHRSIVLSIAIMESVLSAICVGLLCHFAQNHDQNLVRRSLMIPMCFTDTAIVGIMYGLAILCSMESILGIWLVNAVKNVRLNQINFWLLIHLTSEVVMFSFVVGVGLAGCSNDHISSVSFLKVFLRFLEFGIIFIYVEQETLKKMSEKARIARETFAPLSNATTYSDISSCGISQEEEASMDPIVVVQEAVS